jgi:hypothetical protein
VEEGWESEADEDLLAMCVSTGRTLVTNNVNDFMVIARRWAVQGRGHSGLIFSADSSMPRTRENIGGFVRALDGLERANPTDDAFVDRTAWL